MGGLPPAHSRGQMLAAAAVMQGSDVGRSSSNAGTRCQEAWPQVPGGLAPGAGANLPCRSQVVGGLAPVSSQCGSQAVGGIAPRSGRLEA